MEEVKFALKEVRKRKKVTQVELAERTGIHQQSISRYESGGKIPQIDTAYRIAQALGVSLDELIIIRNAHDHIGEQFIKLSKKKTEK